MLDPPPSDKAAMVNIIEMVYEVQIPENVASFADNLNCSVFHGVFGMGRTRNCHFFKKQL
jgi:hypothetical protein